VARVHMCGTVSTRSGHCHQRWIEPCARVSNNEGARRCRPSGGRSACRPNERQTVSRKCRQGASRALRRARSYADRRCRKVPVENGRTDPTHGTAFPVRSFWRRNAPDRRRTDGVLRGRQPLACGRRSKPGRFDQPAEQRQEGKIGRKVRSAAWEGKPLKGKPQRRHRRETKPEGSREEQRVKRLRKPGGAAQSGEASPVLVASRFRERQRGPKPHEGSRFARRFTVGQTLKRSKVHERMRRCVEHPIQEQPRTPRRSVRKTKVKEGDFNR
jgi:hypothetical protein